ncbi:MAG: S-layer family protein [Bacteroidetes bacterium]|nr:S-layer family protein [Bacteroidota bacterium]
MRRINKIALALLGLAIASSSSFAQTSPRVFGAGELKLDDGSGNNVYLSTKTGTLGIDASGNVIPGVQTFPSNCALLDLTSTTKGFLTPRMTTAQELAICGGTPNEGLIVYNTTTHTLDIYNGISWGAVSGWNLTGNTLPAAGGGTGVGQNFIGTLNGQDFVIATNVGVAGSGAGERIRVTSSGNVGISATGSAFTPAKLFNVDGTAGTANVRLASLSGAPLLVPALNLANDGITIAGINGDLLKYDAATVVGTVAWLRTGNTVLDGNNTLGTINDITINIKTNNTTRVTIGNSASANAVTITGNETINGNDQVNGTLSSTGNTTLGTNAATTNSLGNTGASTNNIGNGAGATNNIGNGGGATSNTFGATANLNNFGNGAVNNQYGNAAGTNLFGTNATTNNMGTSGTSTNNILGATNINVTGGNATNIATTAAATTSIGVTAGTNNIAGATNINTGGAATTNINTFAGGGAVNIGGTTHTGAISIAANTGSAITLDVANTANNLIANNINQDNSTVNLLTLTGVNSGNVRTRTLSGIITGSNGVDVTWNGTTFDAHLAPDNATVLFANNRFINTNASTLSITSGNPGTTVLFTAAGNTVNVNNAVAGTTNIGNVAGSTNQIGSSATLNQVGNSAATNQFGNNATSNNFGNVANTNQFGENATGNEFGVSNSAANVTNAIGSNTNTGNVTNNIGNRAGAGAVTTNIGTVGTTAINIGSTGAGGNVSISASNGHPITIDVANTANNLVANNINQDNTTVNLLTLTGVNSGNVRTRSLSGIITGSNGVDVSWNGVTFDAHLAANNSTVLFASDRFINTNASTLHITSGGPAGTDFATFAGTTIGLNNTAVGTNNIGFTGGTNTIAGNTTINNNVNNTTQINTGTSTGAVTIGADNVGATTNIQSRTTSIGTNSASQTVNVGTSGIVNVQGAPVNINQAGAGATNINRTGTGATSIGNTTGGSNFTGRVTLNASTPINDGASDGTSNQVLHSNGAGNTPTWITLQTDAATLIASNGIGTPFAIDLTHANTWTGNQTFGTGASNNTTTIDVGAAGQFVINNLLTDASPTNWLSINGANQVRMTPIAGTALEGIVYSTGAYRLGSTTAGNGAGTNPFLANRHVNLDNFSLDFTVGNNTSQLLTLNANTNAVTVSGATNNVNGTTLINNNVNSNTSINTGASTGAVTVGNAAAGAIAMTTATTLNMTSGTTTTIASATTNVNTVSGNVGVGNAAGTVGIAGTTSINASVNDATNVNTGTSTGAVNIGNNTAGSGVVTITSNKGGNANSIVLDVTNSATNNLQLLNIAADAAPTQVLTLNGTNQVRVTSMAGTALEGVVYTGGAYRLGSTLTSGAGSNPFLATRNVNLDASNLNFTSNNGALTPVQIVGGATPQFNVAATTNINTGTYALTKIGNGSSNHQLEINGVVDAVSGDALASGHWDLAVTGDIAASGIIKSGASIIIDGVAATRQVLSDAAMNIVTNAGQLTLIPGSGTAQVTGNLIVTNGETVQNGGLTVSNGGIVASTGNITATTGDIAAPAGNLNAGQNATITGNITSTTGNITASAGNIVATAGNINATAGSIQTNGVTRIANNGVVTATGLRGNFVTKAANYTVDAGGPDYFIKATAAAITIQLPASGGNTGRIIVIRNTAGAAINVTNSGADTIDGAAAVAGNVGAGVTRTFVADGAGDWVSY